MRNIRDCLSKMAAGMAPIIDTEFALTDFERGLERLESRQVFGKVIVQFLMATARIKRRLRQRLKQAGNAAVGALVVSLLKLLRLINPDRMANFGGWLMRTIGPLLRENEIARDKL